MFQMSETRNPDPCVRLSGYSLLPSSCRYGPRRLGDTLRVEIYTPRCPIQGELFSSVPLLADFHLCAVLSLVSGDALVSIEFLCERRGKFGHNHTSGDARALQPALRGRAAV